MSTVSEVLLVLKEAEKVTLVSNFESQKKKLRNNETIG